MIQPPTTGPMVGASTAMMPAIVVASGCWRQRKQQEYRGKYRGDQRAAGKALQHAEADQHRKAVAEGAADRGHGKKADRRYEQPSQGQDARQPSGQRNGDDFRDQIGGLDPADRIGRNRQRVLDRRQRCRDHLDVEDRHEHAEAHQDEAEPNGGAGPDRFGGRRAHGAVVSRDAASARFSARMRIASTTALRTVKIAASHGR